MVTLSGQGLQSKMAMAQSPERPKNPPEDGKAGAAMQKRYAKAIVRDLGADKGKLTELDAVIAYLQRLGTQVDFKLYDDKANIR